MFGAKPTWARTNGFRRSSQSVGRRLRGVFATKDPRATGTTSHHRSQHGRPAWAKTCGTNAVRWADLCCIGAAGRALAASKSIAHLVPLMPRILAGKPLLPAKRTMRLMVTHDLPAGEQQYLEHTLKHDSGKADRAMICGLARVPMNSVRCSALCLSGREDRIVSRRIAAAIAARYNATHYEFPDRGHWLVAPSNLDVVAMAALQ
jgi:pimeloyl-ACP methyl ester carboxylesterase